MKMGRADEPSSLAARKYTSRLTAVLLPMLRSSSFLRQYERCGSERETRALLRLLAFDTDSLLGLLKR